MFGAWATARIVGECVLRAITLGLVAISLLLPQSGNAAEPLKLGVVPYLSTRALMGFYEPLQKALEAKFNRRVDLVTAPDYTVFHQRTLAGEYDIVITNPVFARIAQREANFEPVARATTNLTPLIIVAQASPAKTLEDLNGKTIAITEAIATITQIGQQVLRLNGVKDLKFVVTRGHTNSIAFLQRGEADAAISSVTAIRQAVPEARNSVRVIREIASPVPPIIYLAAPGRPGLTASSLREALFAFSATDAGKRYAEALGHEGLSPVISRDMALLDEYVGDLKTQLK